MITDRYVPPHPLNIAVLFLVFNRLNTTKQVFAAIREAKPPRLYISADGAREAKEGEAEKVTAVRDFILQNIDWECEVKTLFREENLGCKYAVSGAIDWFFEQEEMGIILEDDCLPSQSFFWFCEELLVRYVDDKRIFLISGDGRATSNVEITGDYSLSKYPMIWGWASWRRVWVQYDVEMLSWSKEKINLINRISKSKKTSIFWKETFDKTYQKEIDTWDFQLFYLLLFLSRSCIVPRLNLISNIGFGSDATHTIDANSSDSNIPKLEIEFPIQHKNFSDDEINRINNFYDNNIYLKKYLIIRIVNKLSRIIFNRNII